ncbi:putative PP-loop family protein [Lyophyllum shimeji]|uniref:tRNA(Ile)-lysidine synthetase n=1 Tax=Lyophyllum shimeji TaxID=47721 RepID=A0A9P3PF33_LYOSH|nr:putative PP-loop family protein [Lyophyllum shimeji]
MGVAPLPIARDEFARMFHKCVPPVGWMKSIGVANSGGPDSTCLLFLIHRYLSDKRHALNHPERVVSFTVDHDLQSTSAAMADHAAKFARSLGLQHVTFRIPWSQPPFPPKPVDGQSFEYLARTARYDSLFQAMNETDVKVIGLGHHADDQIETALMRLSWGSTAEGAGGMRPCRRWGMGMGIEGQGMQYGFEGMDRWIVRPLLDVGKERILATCDENRLEYVIDPTNFQPSATLRNAIRHIISRSANDREPQPSQQSWSPEILKRLRMLERTANSLNDLTISLRSPLDELRSGVRALTLNVLDTEDKVDSILRRYSRPTLPGTFLMSSRGLEHVHDSTTRRALILRILRYVSFHPWGSMRAHAKRRKAAIGQIVDTLWRPMDAWSILRPFTAGGGVLWTPVVLKARVACF